MTAQHAGFALIVLGLLLLAGKFLRLSAPPLQRLFMPSSVIAGVLGLLLGPEVLGRMSSGFHGASGLFPAYVIDVWTALPGLLINVIFAGLFLGKKIPGIRDVWMVAGPQVAFGQTIAWGQYVVGIALALLVLTPMLGAPPMVGALIEIGFQGGHGTAAGLKDTFEKVGFEEATDLALGLATVGVVSGLLFGVWAIQWGTRRGYSNTLDRPSEANPQDLLGVADPSDREVAGWLTTRSSSIDVLTLSAAFLGVAILMGQVLLEGLILIESSAFGSEFMTYVPLFPLAMIGGLILQLILSRFDRFQLLDRGMVVRIQNLALDLLIVSAVATLSLTVLGENLVVFLLLAVAGVAWNVFVFVKLARRMIPEYWFERGIGDTGQSFGMTATGLLLIRMADPDHKSPAMEAFGYKQLLFEPVVGGGLFTAISVPLIFEFGPVPVLGLAFSLMLGFMLLGLLYFGRSPASPARMD